MYISRLCYDVSVRLSVRLSAHWRIIANLDFKFRSHFTAHCARRAACGGSSRAMLASARLSYFISEPKLREAPTQILETGMDMCRIGVSFIDRS